MALIIWDDAKFSVKNSTIDSQHQRLVEMINELNEAMASRKGFDITNRVLEKAVAYTVYHFQTEEELMEKFAYPDRAAHKAQHEAFKAKVTALKRDFSEHDASVPRELLSYLRDWLTQHIVTVDRELGTFLLDHESKPETSPEN
jgi:hemerythrin